MNLNDRLTFQARAAGTDAYGNEQAGAWTDQFTLWARVAPSPGTETVTAARLNGQNPVDVWVRWSASLSANIRTDWRAVDARDPTRIFEIRSVTDPEKYRKQFRLLTCVLGSV